MNDFLIYCDDDEDIPDDNLGVPPAWIDIDYEDRRALLEWYNVSEPDYDDLQLLAELFHAGQFSHGECANCGEPYYYGTPDNWHNFQGVNQSEMVDDVCSDCYQQAAHVIELSGLGYIE